MSSDYSEFVCDVVASFDFIGHHLDEFGQQSNERGFLETNVSIFFGEFNIPKIPFFLFRHSVIESDIVGLRSLQRPLDYLGIFYCDIAAHYHRIPAKKVTFVLFFGLAD